MNRLSISRRLLGTLATVAVLIAVVASTAAAPAPPNTPTGGTVLQTNLVSDLPGVAAVTDPNLVNPWGISSSATSPFWISDNGAGVSTLYQVPGANNTEVSINPLVVSIATPASDSKISAANMRGILSL